MKKNIIYREQKRVRSTNEDSTKEFHSLLKCPGEKRIDFIQAPRLQAILKE